MGCNKVKQKTKTEMSNESKKKNGTRRKKRNKINQTEKQWHGKKVREKERE